MDIIKTLAEGEYSKIDATALGTEALTKAKADAFKRANELLGDASHQVTEADFTAAQNLLKGVDGFEEEIQRRREIDGMRSKASGGIASLMTPASMPFADPSDAARGRKGISAGRAFIESELYQSHSRDGSFRYEPKSGRFPQFGIEVAGRDLMRRKSLLYTGSAVGGAFVIPEYEMDWEPASRPGPDILDLLRVVPTQSDTINWIRQDTRSASASTVAEATVTTGTTGSKPETTLAFSRQSTPVETLAVWIAATNQQIADAAELRSIIDDELTYDLMLELDNQILNGNGTSPNLTGILNASIQSVAYVATTHGNEPNALLRAMMVIATANEPAPTGIVLNPLDWEPIRALRESGAGLTATGTYLMGPPSEMGASTLWGLPVVVTNRITANTGLLGNFQAGARLHMREDSSIKIGMANDDFIRNIVRVLAELRAALTVRRPSAFCKVTGI